MLQLVHRHGYYTKSLIKWRYLFTDNIALSDVIGDSQAIT